MPGLAEIARALYGAYRLARFDPRGLQFFDASLDGFWKSFFAAVLVAPFYAVLQLERFYGESAEPAAFRYLSIQITAYVIAWVVYPLLMVSVAKALDRERNYLGYIVAYNWASVLQNGLFIPLILLIETGVIPIDAGVFVGLMAQAAILTYSWFIAKHGLNIQGPMAAGLVALDFALGIVVNGFATSLSTA